LRAAFTPRGGALSDQGRWLVDTICANVADMHWARMQEHDVLYTDPHAQMSGPQVLYLGDAAHGMVPTLGQGATQAIEDAAVAADLIVRAWAAGRRDPRAWLDEIDALRRERMRFVMELSLEATDTMLEGADPVAGTLHKKQPDFMARLRRLYQEVPGLPAMATKS
jgi:salicylate hydroxylase